jgi:DNA-binding MarR family transcriptional regulator
MTQPDTLAQKLERAMRLYNSTAYTNDLRPAQWQALRYFANAPTEERTLSHFAQARASTMGTTSVTVTALVKRGLLERSRRDRNVGLQITEKGRRYLETSDPAKSLANVIADLPVEERQVLDGAVARIIDTFESTLNETR